MSESMDTKHPIRQLLQPQSEYLIPFNYFLLGDPGIVDAYGQIAPPTSIAAPQDVLKLEDRFAEGRKFFDDDPKNELVKNGIVEADFTAEKAWDLFPAAQNLLRIWDICENFVKAFVSNTYPNDDAVAADKGLQKWMDNSANPDQGNIRGLPELKNRGALIRLLTSQVYRLTAHGVSRLPRSTDPWLTFVANFPPCLQRTDLPPPNAPLSTQVLLKYLPNVRTIADTLAFYFAFAYSKPYAPLIRRPDRISNCTFVAESPNFATKRSSNFGTKCKSSWKTTLMPNFRRDTTSLTTRNRGCSGRATSKHDYPL